MDRAILSLSKSYARRDRGRTRREAYEGLLDLYEHYTGEEPGAREHKAGLVDKGMAKGAAFAARTAVLALRLGPLKYPAALLARQGVQRSREARRLIDQVRDDRELLEPLVKPLKPRWRLP